MKKIYVITMAAFFLQISLNAFAAGLDMAGGVNTTQTTSRHVETIYNPYGVALSSTEKINTTTRTTDGKGAWQETTSEQTVYSSWKGGSLKMDKVTGNSKMTAKDGAHSETNFSTNYVYNDNGQLKGASGGSSGTGDLGKDDKGQALGTYTVESTDNYIIRNGQALLSSSVATQKTSGPDGKLKSTTTTTKNSDYQLIAGTWQLTQERETSTTNSTDGSTDNITRTTNYQRDPATGVCKGISQTATGSATQVNGNGGRQGFTLSNYKAEFKFDEKVGFYLAKESYDWSPNPAPAPAAADPAISGKLQVIGGELYMVVDEITDHNGTYEGEGKIVKIQAAAGEEVNLEGLKQLVMANGDPDKTYTVWGDYLGDGADSYSSMSFQFHGVGFGPFVKK